MMISKLHSLLFETTSDYHHNLATLIQLIERCEEHSFAVAGEVSLTGYDYDNFDAMITFSDVAIPQILQATKNKTVVLTMLAQENGVVKNFAYVFHNGAIVHKQPKAQLFKFGDEHKYIAAGDPKDIVLFEIDGVKIGIMICFELRFKSFWQQLEGADIIAIPSWWGKLREQNYLSLTNALAIMNQCYVVCSDNLNEECHGQSGIITPFGEEQRNGNQKVLTCKFDPQEIKKMRRYMDVGIGVGK